MTDHATILRNIKLFSIEEIQEAGDWALGEIERLQAQIMPDEPTEQMLVDMDNAFGWLKAGEGVTPSYYGPRDNKYEDLKDAYQVIRATLC